MKIGIIDADLMHQGAHYPNLALMKISGHHKRKGHNARILLRTGKRRTGAWRLDELSEPLRSFDKVFVSKVFTHTEAPPELLAARNVEHGGTGFFLADAPPLPRRIERGVPDYKLYDAYIESERARGCRRSFANYELYSMGMTTRGCFRKCPFCVNQKYDASIRWSMASEFVDPRLPRINLLDDNVLACEEWPDIFAEVKATRKQFVYRQGFDIRLLTEASARAINDPKYSGAVTFAFDLMKFKKQIESKLELWRGITRRPTVVFLLVAFESLDVRDVINTFYRIRVCMKFHCTPLIMRFQRWRESPYARIYQNLAGWCFGGCYYYNASQSFREYCKMNGMTKSSREKYQLGDFRYDGDRYLKDGGSKGSSWLSMEEFESLHPDVAREFFDLRLKDVRKY